MHLRAIALIMVCLICTGCSWLKQPAPKPDKAEPARVAANVTVEGQPMGGLTRGEVEAVLRTLAYELDTPPVNACFNDASGAITAGKVGRRLDITATADRAMNAGANTSLDGVYQEIEPAITSDALRQARTLGSFCTPILDKSPGRLHNIKLTAQHINNVVIEPGSEFSFNIQTGEPTAQRGFKEATVFIDGRAEQDVGGGMCQVSSTLYNAALNAGLTITERHAHSQPVSYVPPGRDATTYTDKDLRFVNTTRQRLVIRAIVTDDKMVVDLLGLPQ